LTQRADNADEQNKSKAFKTSNTLGEMIIMDKTLQRSGSMRRNGPVKASRVIIKRES
jgi:hypothetical protein